jgi:hypothetical protein
MNKEMYTGGNCLSSAINEKKNIIRKAVVMDGAFVVLEDVIGTQLASSGRVLSAL